MVRLDRSARVSRGKFPEASQWAKDATAYLRKNFGTNTECFVQRFGPVGVIVWQSDYPSLGELDSTIAKMNADKAWSATLATSGEKGLFVEGSIVDRLLVTLA